LSANTNCDEVVADFSDSGAKLTGADTGEEAVAQKKRTVELKKLSESTNSRLIELLSEIVDDSDNDSVRPSAKPTWGRRFNASGKNKSTAPKIQNSY